MSKDHDDNRRELLEEITLLKEKIYTIEKESDIELQNLKDRLIVIHSQDTILGDSKSNNDSKRSKKREIMVFCKEAKNFPETTTD